jgi:hypothetical protein
VFAQVQRALTLNFWEIDMLKIKCARPPFSMDGHVEFLMIDRDEDGKRAVVKNLTLETVEQGAYLEPTGTMDQQSAQELMDNLWECGLRPSEGAGSAGAMAATERHLADMRKIALAALNKVGVKSE